MPKKGTQVQLWQLYSVEELEPVSSLSLSDEPSLL
ncbi:hypothetical protein A2U01_0098984, partial [Trifolium medium]|nr:hypothetical protein [Trifolium medium]